MHDSALTVAISPCPNDSFIFGAWALGLVPEASWAGRSRPTRWVWSDVQDLNEAASLGRYDVVKVSSAHAASLDDYEVLSSGAAFGLGAGPKLVSRAGFTGFPGRVAVPGMQTTAFALLRGMLGPDFEPVPVRFDLIVSMVQAGEVDAGLLIHETALIYDRYGLQLLMDLGEWWARATNCLPLPLGCIVARKSLGAEGIAAVDAKIRESLEYARRERAELRPFLRSLAREMDDDVLDAHVTTYVNDMSLDMGGAGREALAVLARMKTGRCLPNPPSCG